MNGSGRPPRDELSGGADRRGLALPPWVTRTVIVAAVVIAVPVAVVAGYPHLFSASGPSNSQPTSSPSPTVEARAYRPQQDLDWAPRGDTDSVFARAALSRMRSQRPDVYGLLWAGRVGSQQVALAVYRTPAMRLAGPVDEVGALVVDDGGSVQRAHATSLGDVRRGQFVGYASRDTASGRTSLVLLGAPGEDGTVGISTRLQYDARGYPFRTYRDMPLVGGVLQAGLGTDTDPSIAVLPGGHEPQGNGTAPQLLSVRAVRSITPYPDWRLSGLAGTYNGPDREFLVAELASLVRPVFDIREADSSVVWSGPVVGGHDVDRSLVRGRAAVLRMRRDDGQVFQALVFVDADRRVTSQLYAVVASDPDLLPAVFAPPGEDGPVLLLNPSGAGTVQVTRTSGDVQRVRTSSKGVGVLTTNRRLAHQYDAAHVVVRDARHHVALRAVLPDPRSDPVGQ